MLKKAGIVVLGATAGVMSLSGMAFAGESGGHSMGDNDKSTSHHHSGDKDKGRDGGSCNNKIAATSGDRLVSLDNLASNLDISRVNVLAQDESLNIDEDGCEGGNSGNKAALTEGDRLISADNLLANADVERLNLLLASDESANVNG